MSFSWALLQEEQYAWATYNFPGRSASEPLLGIFEELGELDDAIARGARDEALDAVGDTMIFMADYCSQRNWRLDEVVGAAGPLDRPLLQVIGSFSHAHLKTVQGVRTQENHEGIIRRCLGSVVAHLERVCGHFEQSLLRVVEDVWRVVKARDWRSNSVDGSAPGKARNGSAEPMLIQPPLPGVVVRELLTGARFLVGAQQANGRVVDLRGECITSAWDKAVQSGALQVVQLPVPEFDMRVTKRGVGTGVVVGTARGPAGSRDEAWLVRQDDGELFRILLDLEWTPAIVVIHALPARAVDAAVKSSQAPAPGACV